MSRGSILRLMQCAAAMPTDCAADAKVSMTRVEPKATCEALTNTPGDEQIANILAVLRSVRDLVDAFCVPLIAARAFAENAISRMQVDGPAAEGYGIVMLPLLQ